MICDVRQVTSITDLESNSSMRINNGDVVKHKMLEIKPTSTAKFDCRRFGSNPTVGDCEVENWACGCLWTDCIIPCINVASSDYRVV